MKEFKLNIRCKLNNYSTYMILTIFDTHREFLETCEKFQNYLTGSSSTKIANNMNGAFFGLKENEQNVFGLMFFHKERLAYNCLTHESIHAAFYLHKRLFDNISMNYNTIENEDKQCFKEIDYNTENGEEILAALTELIIDKVLGVYPYFQIIPKKFTIFS